MIKIIDDMLRGQQMKPTQIVTQVNPQGAVVRIRPTLYSPWGIRLTAVPNAYYVLTYSLHLSSTGYVQRHPEGHKLVAAWDLTISITNATARKIFRYWRKILTQTTLCKILTTVGESVYM